MADDRLSQAILAIESGNTETAKGLLAAVLRQDPANADAWRWMAIALDDPAKKRQCWQRVLSLRPSDEQAMKALAGLEAARQAVSAPKSQPAARAKPKKRNNTLLGVVLLSFIIVVVICGGVAAYAFRDELRGASDDSSNKPLLRTMYFCGYDRCRDSLQYGTMIEPPILAIHKNHKIEPGGFIREPKHGEKVGVIGEWRDPEWPGPGGLWFELEGEGWTREWNLTETICTPTNLDRYSYKSCGDGEY
jgi:hypothetical protein